jgi:hypothetical protein
MEIYVMHDGQQLGPFSLETVQAQLDSGVLSAADYAWGVGIDDTASLSDVVANAFRTMPGDETREKRKLTSRIGAALHRIATLIDRQLTAKRVIAATVLLLVASWIYPPWIIDARSHGWFFIFDTTQSLEMRVDFGRLFLIDAVIAAIGALLAWAAFYNWTPFRVAAHLAVYSLLIAPAVAVVFLVAFLAERHLINRRTLDPFRYIGSLPVGGTSSQEIKSVDSPKPARTPGTQPEGQPVDASAVASGDLKKISLFDVGVHGYKSSITGLYGRVRNDLARAVQKIAVKASFYTSREELIEVRTFWIRHGAGMSWEAPFFPNAPVSFDEHLVVDHLPDGYKYQLEVTEARYAN